MGNTKKHNMVRHKSIICTLVNTLIICVKIETVTNRHALKFDLSN